MRRLSLRHPTRPCASRTLDLVTMVHRTFGSHLTLRNLLISIGIFTLFALYNFWSTSPPVLTVHDEAKPPRPIPHESGSPVSNNFQARSCIGPRGKPIAESPDDQVRYYKVGRK